MSNAFFGRQLAQEKNIEVEPDQKSTLKNVLF